VAIGGLYATAQYLQPAAIPRVSVSSVSLLIDGSSWSLRYQPRETMNNSAFDLLLEASHAQGFPVVYDQYELPKGVFVIAINGSTNGVGGRYWQYWVDGVYGNVAADHYELHDGDVVAWKFVSSQEGG
jgi:hypothetical protein